MKVRARVKAVEFFPEWAKCCTESIFNDQFVGECIVDLSTKHYTHGLKCDYCLSEMPDYPSVMMLSGVGKGSCFPLELLDLDEGPLEETA